MINNVLVIGAGGGIARELVEQLCRRNSTQVYTVSRSDLPSSHANQQHTQLDSTNEEQVANFVKGLKEQGVSLHSVICTTGVLHTSGNMTLKPEKRLEDINQEQLAEYFRVNTAVPAIWLKYLVKIVDKTRASIIFFSARVGSISENSLGGWYGYRASKAALNMIVKTASVEYKRRAPNTVLGCYHPGTVDTGLSKPFQGNVKPGKLFTPEFTVSQLLKHIQSFDAEHSPYYFDWEGKTIAY
jgi:NAD(P)-dependent dehydrogenase (short-subunit alcohol dehydrogenase family)